MERHNPLRFLDPPTGLTRHAQRALESLPNGTDAIGVMRLERHVADYVRNHLNRPFERIPAADSYAACVSTLVLAELLRLLATAYHGELIGVVPIRPDNVFRRLGWPPPW